MVSDADDTIVLVRWAAQDMFLNVLDTFANQDVGVTRILDQMTNGTLVITTATDCYVQTIELLPMCLSCEP
ncbi:hypothetical protein AF72_03105 [Xylella taiwanensis]|uniref:Uncharacterized protein n=1 Tax=Xylella taiwanensis TaxID=1444770 RepID=Z9JLR6_9GAMM|nr:hypothetical protein [Xylella taiwanensis]AXI84195.1 hypothetical protein AB672_09725 [Xylella taiwanensis]EWS78923.1 hypothetical protein AF72_03105 [Xylella taiwanensis]